MSYLKEIQNQLANHNYASLLTLWEEYCNGDEIDPEELVDILKSIKQSEFAESFGRHVEKILPLWGLMPESSGKDETLKWIIDLETTNTPALFDLTLEFLKKKYGASKDFNEKMRLISIRNQGSFQGAISKFELLNHMHKGKYVFHSGGFGVGEILDVSLVRQQLTVDFDLAAAKKDISFENALRSLIPLPDDHFLALRFGNPDLLEKEAKENPLGIIRKLLKDLGPKTAAEIKDELCELVIPEEEWTKWWQNARSKIKKDTFIESPEEARLPFRLRKKEVPHDIKLRAALEQKLDPTVLIPMVYSFMRDFPETLKNSEFKEILKNKLHDCLSSKEMTSAQEVQIRFFLSDLGEESQNASISELIKKMSSMEELVHSVEIQAFKRRILTLVRKEKEEWPQVFLNLLFAVEGSGLRDYIFTELLNSPAKESLKKKLEDLSAHPTQYGDALIWYFQKIIAQQTLPFADKEGKCRFLEGFFILLHRFEQDPHQRDQIKKMQNILSQDRYQVIRDIFKGASIAQLQEFLLLATKCHSFSDHDLKILESLAEVVHPSLAKKKKTSAAPEEEILWTTAAGYKKTKDRIEQIATVETVENAKEIEIARSHGDLRENQEFKSALEKRSRLQNELKALSDMINRARVITADDISKETVGIGNIVICKNGKGETITFTLLGPWDAEPEKNILSFQSKLAQSMIGLKVGASFKLQDDEYTIKEIKSFLK